MAYHSVSLNEQGEEDPVLSEYQGRLFETPEDFSAKLPPGFLLRKTNDATYGIFRSSGDGHRLGTLSKVRA